MVAIKGMEMPKDCKKCPLMGTDGNTKDLLNPMMCVAIWATTHEIKHCVEGKILDDCPLVEIEERKVGKLKAIDDTHSQCSECGATFCITSSDEWEVSYCPNCGAEMRGSEK